MKSLARRSQDLPPEGRSCFGKRNVYPCVRNVDASPRGYSGVQREAPAGILKSRHRSLILWPHCHCLCSDSLFWGFTGLKIKDILSNRRTISFEFFPPREADGVPGVVDVASRLQRFAPDFISVTYGAGGGTRAFTEEITMRLKRRGDMEVMAHLTCVAQSREEVHGVLQRLQAAGIENVIALRGDRPAGNDDEPPGEDEFAHATELIEHIGANFDFGIAGACYPEGHTESISLETDIEYARLKQDLGADFLITQLFYDNSHFYGLQDRAATAGITIPHYSWCTADFEHSANSSFHLPVRRDHPAPCLMPAWNASPTTTGPCAKSESNTPRVRPRTCGQRRSWHSLLRA